MERISRITLYLETAKLNARRSTCERGQVGAILVRDKRIIASGYNNPPMGQPHCQDHHCDLSETCTHTIHAEANLIAYCAKQGIATAGAILVVTTVPCKKCSELVVQAGIKRIVYDSDYRLTEGVDILTAAGVDVIKYSDQTKFNDGFFI